MTQTIPQNCIMQNSYNQYYYNSKNEQMQNQYLNKLQEQRSIWQQNENIFIPNQNFPNLQQNNKTQQLKTKSTTNQQNKYKPKCANNQRNLTNNQYQTKKQNNNYRTKNITKQNDNQLNSDIIQSNQQLTSSFIKPKQNSLESFNSDESTDSDLKEKLQDQLKNNGQQQNQEQNEVFFEASIKKPKRHFQSDEDRLNFVKNYQMKFKTEMCKNWEEYGKCKYKDTCSFAHGYHELQQKRHLPQNFKTKMCQQFHESSYCPYGNRCQFLHSQFNIYNKKYEENYQLQLLENCRLSWQRSINQDYDLKYINIFGNKKNRLQVFKMIENDEF